MTDDAITLDPWAWAREDDGPATPSPVSDRVLAILVSRNGEAWLPQALAGLAAQTRRPDRVVAVDNGSEDGTAAVLAAAVAAGTLDAVVTGSEGAGFGAAVDQALAAETEEPAWLWLLHDDAVAEPDCLAELLAHIGRDDTVAITGPKLLQPSRRLAGRQISELGVSITRTGERELALAPGEIDQGQHEAAATLGVSTCGMLVRTSTYRALDGFDPAVPLFRDGVELGWRANLAGHRVVTSPRAVMTHRQVGRAGVRRGVTHPTARDRSYGMLTVAAHHRGLAGPLVALGLMLATLVRALFFVVGKAPGRAMDELRALRLFVGQTAAAHRLRARVTRLRATPEARDRTRRLRPSARSVVARLWGAALTWASDTWTEAFGARGSDTSLDELTGDDYAGRAGRRTRRPWAAPTMLTIASVFVLALVAGRRLLRPGHLASTLLLPAQEGATAMLRDYVAPIPGSPGEVAAPWVGLMGLGSLLTLGSPEVLVSLLVLGAVPLATLTGHAFLRRLANDRRTRLVGAVAYGLLPAMLGAVSRGDLGLIVYAIVLPLLGRAVLAWRRRGTTGFESWRGPFAVGLGLTVLAAFSPAVWLLALLAGLVAAIATRGRHATRVLVALAVPVALLSPWLGTLAAHPGRLLTGFDPVLRGTDPVGTAAMMIGRTPGGGLPPVWLSGVFFGVLWLLGLLGLALRPRAARGWALLAIGGLALAVAVTRFIVVVPMAGEATRPQAGVYVLIGFAGLIALIAQGWDHVQGMLAERAFGLLHGVSLASLVLATLATLAGAGWWVAAGEAAPLHRTSMSGVPAVARQMQASGAQLRTLVVDLRGVEPLWNLTEGDGTRLGDTERGEAFGGSPAALDDARAVVADLVVGRGDDDTLTTLVRLGVGHVVVRNAAPDVLATIGSLPGLTQVSADERGRVWRVTPVRSRAMLVTGDRVEAAPANGDRLETGQPGRRLVLAEPLDARWRLTVDGREVAPVTVEGDPRQWFAVGDRAGEVRWALAGSRSWAWFQLAGLLVVSVLAAPSLRRTEHRDPELYARRAARLDQEEVA